VKTRLFRLSLEVCDHVHRTSNYTDSSSLAGP
jgi:hypothetical protein